MLDSYTGQYSFTFLLNTNGMRLYNEDGQYYLATSAEAEEKMYLGQIVVYDAKGEPCPGTMSITTVTMGQQYQITVSADPAFLTNPNTEYPVTIDPSLTISDSTQSGAIEDASVYENKPTVNAGSWTYNHCGYYTSSSTVYGVSRTVYRLTGLINDANWPTIVPEDIVSAKLYVKEASGEAGATLNIRALSNTTWTELGITWNTLGGHYTTVYASSAPGYGAWGEWDITNLVLAWKYGTRSILAGFEMVSADEFADSKTLYASEYGTADRRPYFTVTYDLRDSDLNHTSVDVDEGSSVQLNWIGVASAITWRSSDESIAAVSSTGLVTGIKAGTATITASAAGYITKTCTVYVTIQDGVYYINASNGISLGTGGSTTNFSPISTYYQNTSETSKYHQLWEVKYESSGQYSIRSIGNGNVLLYRSANQAVTYHYSATSAVPLAARWTIEYASLGYVLKSCGYTQYTLTVDGNDSASNQNVKAVSYAATSPQAHWQFEMITGVLLLNATTRTILPQNTGRILEMGTTCSMASLGILPLYSGVSVANYASQWSSSSSPSANLNSANNTIIASNRGQTILYANVTIKNTTYRQSLTLSVVETISVINLYDCSVTGNNNIIDNIDDAVNFLNTVYSGFYLRFVMDGTPTPLNAEDDHIDKCDRRDYDLCHCDTNHENHHKNINKIATEQITEYCQSNHIIINWSDCSNGTYCSDYITYDEDDEPVISCLQLWDQVASTPIRDITNRITYPVAFIYNFEKLDDSQYEQLTYKGFMSLVLAHEVAHTLGLLEIYADDYDDIGEDNPHESTEHTHCIMGRFAKDAQSFYNRVTGGSSGFCSYCINKLSNILPNDLLVDN